MKKKRKKIKTFASLEIPLSAERSVAPRQRGGCFEGSSHLLGVGTACFDRVRSSSRNSV